ncbi:hypothetical protein A2U01_0070225, partial [Trifolium medium]|nr:hypothetical protein [Trifolium medium]
MSKAAGGASGFFAPGEDAQTQQGMLLVNSTQAK